MTEFSRRHFLTATLVTTAAGIGAAASALPGAPAGEAAIPVSHLMQPAQLGRILRGTGSKPLILQVGFRVLYNESHIPGAEFAGPAGEPAGLALLRAQVKSLPPGQPIVIYCGCCPWSHCPNIRAAYAALVKLGFTNAQALYIAQNFGADWIQPGYPVAAA